MKKRILFFLLACLSTAGSMFGQTLENPENLGTWSAPFSTSRNIQVWEHSGNIATFQFTLTTAMNITISHCGSRVESSGIFVMDKNFDVVASDVGNSGHCTDGLAYVKIPRLAAGTYTLQIDWEGTTGNVLTQIEGKQPSIIEIAKNIGTFNTPFNYMDTKNTNNPDNTYQDDSAYNNGVCYAFTLSCSMDIILSHCGSAVDDTRLYLLNEQGYRMDSNDDYDGPDACENNNHAYLVAPNLPSGTYYVVSKGVSGNGNITTRIKGMEARDIPEITQVAQHIGDFSTFFNYTDSKDTGNDNVTYQGYGDYRYGLCYSFFISREMDVTISTCGSGVLDTRLYLLDELGEPIYNNDDYSGINACENHKHAYMDIHLLPGTYYVVSTAIHEWGYVTTQIIGRATEMKIGSPDKNYIITRTYMDAPGYTWQDKLEYFDEMGRNEQTVLTEASPAGGDIISATEYDRFGRQFRKWLPAEVKENMGEYISPIDLQGWIMDANNNDPAPYSLIEYELSELNRPLNQYGPGDDWAYQYKAVKTDYRLTNIADNDSLNCIKYKTSGHTMANDTIVVIRNTGNYPTGTFTATRTTDEDGHSVIEFRNRFDQVVLNRQISYHATKREFYDTYYLYDEWGNLLAVLPPKVSDITSTIYNSISNSSSAALRDYAYLYRYDERFRMTAKRLPGKGWTRYVYDKADYAVLTQDEEQRLRCEWSFSIADANERVCLTGICKNIFPLDSTSVDASVIAVRNNSTGIYKGYQVSGISLTEPQVMTVNYYDDYAFMGKNGIPDSTNVNYKFDKTEEYGKRYMGSANSLLTGTLTARLDNSETTAYLPAVMYYDYRQRMIQSKSSNHLAGGLEKEYVAYSFTGKNVKKQHVHSATGKNRQADVYTYAYDHANRLLTTKHSLNGNLGVTLTNNEYDCLGRLISNKRNGNANLATNISYNVRSWTKSISGPLFSQTLYYNDERENGTNTTCYNGNISGMDWCATSDSIRHGYDFSYDGLSQLTKANYLKNNLRSNHFNTSYSYDKQGNLLTLQRYGQTGIYEYGLIDDLKFTLNGNQLRSVSDAVGNTPYNDGFQFKNGSVNTLEYTYDKNGNLIKDLNKKITDIQYNFLNLPYLITFEDGSTISYTYDADGKKLRTVHNIGGTTTTKDYCGNVIYENGIAKTLVTEAGYLSLPDKKHHFFLQDHQGNNRIIADQNGKIEETNHYYPFGGTFASSTSSVQPYKYNGKELDTENGLNWYDYGARMYDPALGRWNAVDPMAEKYYGVSPYVYCDNNPMKNIDPDGKDWYKVQNAEGIWKFTYDENIHSQEELNKIVKNGTYIGVTHTENNIYYSLFGSKKIANSFEGAIYQNIDNAILKEAFAEKTSANYFGGEDIGNPTTNFSIEGVKPKDTQYLGFDTHRNEYSIEYEGSDSGVYNVLGNKEAMKGYMENWVGDKDMPKDIGGWQNGQKAYHIRFMNKKGVDIIHLKYSKPAANTLINKYNRLLLNRK